MDGITPSLSRTIWPVLSKSSCLKCSLQSTDESLAVNPSLLKAISHFFLTSLTLGNLQNENWRFGRVYTKTFYKGGQAYFLPSSSYFLPISLLSIFLFPISYFPIYFFFLQISQNLSSTKLLFWCISVDNEPKLLKLWVSLFANYSTVRCSVVCIFK